MLAQWCTQCGARPGFAAPAEICRICICRSGRLPDWAYARRRRRRALPDDSNPRCRERYREHGLCERYGRRRDRADRKKCARCRKIEAAATLRWRRKHPGRDTGNGKYQRELRERRATAGRCPRCGGERDTDRKHCATCRAATRASSAAHRARRAAE